MAIAAIAAIGTIGASRSRRTTVALSSISGLDLTAGEVVVGTVGHVDTVGTDAAVAGSVGRGIRNCDGQVLESEFRLTIDIKGREARAAARCVLYVRCCSVDGGRTS